MLIQSLLFFILGVSSTAWLLVLLAPLIWRKAVHFAQKSVSAQIPLSLTEVQANYDFLCAQHAVELARNEQKYEFLQKKYAQQKIQLSQTTEQLYRSCLPTQNRSSSSKEAITTKQNLVPTNSFIREMKTMHEKIAHYQQRLQKIQINALNTTQNQQLLNALREETKELAATLAAEIALQEGATSPISALIKNSKNTNDLASRIRKKITCTKKNTST
ncbi:hypothetical protein [Bartonella sp. ML70XJBT.G]|uniref:hypothetical protein n=1 Tax=Bartonella sp. ML70XJBT.G TaxID=3019093 RepID=UPI00235E42A7|nr:hypothetical protein [Bartonella sp. ML70XJBT.G]